MKLIVYLILLLCAVWTGLLLHQDRGALILSYQDWLIEMPMWLAVVLALISIGIVLFCLRLINELFAGYYNSKNYFKASKNRQAKQCTTQALLQLAESKWELAEKNAIKGAQYSDLPFINYVSAAKAAQEQQAWERRDKYLTLAANNVPGGQLSAGLIKAKLQYKQGDLEQSLVTLQDMQEINHKHPAVLNLLSEVYTGIKDWQNLYNLLPELKKYKCCSQEVLQGLTEQTFQGLLLEKMQHHGKQELMRFWKGIPKSMKHNPRVAAVYVSCLCQLELPNDAVDVLKSVLKRVWDKELIKIYGLIQSTNLSRQIFMAEEWLKEHPGDPVLLLTLAKLCIHNQLWGKARDYLEMSIQFDANPEAYAELGRLLSYLGDTERAQDCYKKGLLIATTTRDNLEIIKCFK